ncbi:MAG TPA: PadR family transcriptional regulator [Vicinamibacterales bacterium]
MATMTAPPRPRSPLWLVVLSLVSEEPMHPYRMQVLIKERGKDQIANVSQRNSVYQTITALRRAGLIIVRETSRSERRPERTVYAITPAGARTLHSWMREVLSTPAREFPDFPAALSLVAGATPEEVRALLEARVAALEKRLAELEEPVPGVPRLFLLEAEYMAALVRAQIEWLQAVTGDLRSGRLTWNERWLRQVSAALASGTGHETGRKPEKKRPPTVARVTRRARRR